MSVWDDLDRLRKEHDELVSWLKSAFAAETLKSAWALQDASPDGQYVVARRQTKTREREELRAKTPDGIRQAILDLEKREAEVEEQAKKVPAFSGWANEDDKK